MSAEKISAGKKDNASPRYGAIKNRRSLFPNITDTPDFIEPEVLEIQPLDYDLPERIVINTAPDSAWRGRPDSLPTPLERKRPSATRGLSIGQRAARCVSEIIDTF